MQRCAGDDHTNILNQIPNLFYRHNVILTPQNILVFDEISFIGDMENIILISGILKQRITQGNIVRFTHLP